MENMPWVVQWYGDGCDCLVKDAKMCMMIRGVADLCGEWRFGACSWREDQREQTIHHYVTFPAFSSNFTVTSSQNCVWWTWVSRGVVMIHDNARPHTAAATQNLITTFGWEQFDHPPYSPNLAPSDFHLFLHLNPSLLAGGSTTTTRSTKPLPRALHRRRHHSTMKGYKNCCNAMTSASTMVQTMSKSSVRCVHQMAIYMVCNIFLFFY